MQHRFEKIDGKRVRFTITVSAEEVARAMEHAAKHFAEDTTVPGFRPGQASYEVIKARVGEMKLLEAASEEMVRDTFVAALLDEDISTVGSPSFAIVKMAPGNEFVYTAEVSLMPEVKKLADYLTLSVAPRSTEVEDATFMQAKADLQRMRTAETDALIGAAIEKGDKAIVNLTMKREGVPVEGGDANDHGIYTNEAHYIPGFVDAIIGAKVGDTKSFTLPFPKDHYQKHLAGQDVEFTVTLTGHKKLTLPEWDDAFAKTLGLPSVAELEAKLRENLVGEKVEQEMRRQEKEMLELIAQKSDFDEFSDLLVNQEIDKMVYELQNWVSQQGMEWDNYLKSVGKSITEMKLDFTPQAIMRLKVALVLQAVAEKEKIEIAEPAIEVELDRLAEGVKEDPNARKHLYSPAFRDRIRQQMQNRAVIDFLKGKMVRKD